MQFRACLLFCLSLMLLSALLVACGNGTTQEDSGPAATTAEEASLPATAMSQVESRATAGPPVLRPSPPPP